MSNSDAHNNSQARQLDQRLVAAIALNGLTVAAEIIGGVLAGSLALLSDAVHNLSDVAALVLALAARVIGRRRPSLHHTFGFHRLEVIAAFVNGATLLVVATLVVRAAIVRLVQPEPVNRDLMLVVALIGLGANMLSVILLHHHDARDLNMRAAFLHLVQDTASSVIVVGAAFFANAAFGRYLDPLASLLVISLIFVGTYRLVRRALHILMQGTPPGLDTEELRSDVVRQFGLADMRHIHVWELGAGYHVLTAHLVAGPGGVLALLEQVPEIREYLRREWHIEHATLEVEPVPSEQCTLASQPEL
jgi:cobalt-zinc-cadmium efflux system protein